LQAYLNSLSPDQIAKVEVITNPSTKYEAAGAGGILNIVLKAKPKGLYGSVYSGLTYYKKWGTLLGGRSIYQ